MNTTRKLLAMVLALIMVMSLALSVSAHTITLTGTNQSPTAGHTYTVYQIFTGELTKTENQLINVKYGANYTPDDTEVGDLVPVEDLKLITNAQTFAEDLKNAGKLEGTFGELNSGNSWTLSDVPSGYYLIVDSTPTLPANHTRSLYMIQVVNDVDMAPKSGVVDVVKKVKDTNDSTGVTSDWQDSADYDINDTIPYQITSHFNSIGDFEDYKVVFTDVMSKGLTYNNDVKITMLYTVEGSTAQQTMDVTAAFDKGINAYDGDDAKYVGGNVYTFTCNDLKGLVSDNLTDATIIIDYTCRLNEGAVVGADGNPNKVNLEYDREPNGEGTGTTPDDVNIVFTFKTDVNKVDEEKKPLTGAEFTLEKLVNGKWTTLALVKNNDGTVFSFTGLDDGEYRITETKAPAGYNSIDPIYFTVIAEHEIKSDNPVLTSLSATVHKEDGSSYTEEEIKSGKVASFTVEMTDGNLKTDIVNKAGVVLPETGGMGTTMFYVIGGILVLAAVVLLVTKRRMNMAE